MGHDTAKIISGGETYQGKQGISFFSGVSLQTAGSAGLCMHMLEIPPGGRAKSHRHENHETAIYVLSGVSGCWWGEGLTEHFDCKAGDFVYIPANVPHLPYNPSATEPCVAIISRTDPNEQESVVLLPELEG